MKAFDIGLSALKTQQQTLSVLGNNLANASTPGYHRQRVELASRFPLRDDNLHIGTGVDVTRITRLRDSAIETSLLRNASELGATEKTLAVAQQIESLMTPGDASIHTTLSNFFDRVQKMANAPQDMTVREEFLSSASELVDSFNGLSSQLQSLTRDLRLELDDGVKQVNQHLNDLAELNSKIFQLRTTGSEPNDLLDRRDQLLSELSSWIDADSQTMDLGREQIMVAGGAVVVGSVPVEFQARDFRDGTSGVTLSGLSNPISLTSGKLSSLITALNETIPEFQNRLNELSRQIVREVDQQHAEGMSDQGPYSVLLGSRAVEDVKVPLQYANPEFPIQSGDLYITITEDATGNRRTEKVNIDINNDSLTDVAAKLSALTGVVGTVDSVRKTLMISAEGPYSVDFAGRPDNVPTTSAMTGTSTPRFSGLYTGDVNDAWIVTFSGAGTIGVTEGLTATIRDQAGQIIGVQNVGNGYEAGTEFTLRDGVSLSMGSGTVDATDTFSLAVTSEPDETGILSALGINSLFEGSKPQQFSIRDELRNNPERLATTITGFPGEGLNVASMADLRDMRLDALGGRTFVEELSDITSESGLQVQAAESQNEQLSGFQTRLEADRDAISGVDINQEVLAMMQAERAYQAAARYMSTADQMLEELFNLAR